ncbi:hypothetical protein [Cyanobacterium aponinum]|uniref:hypothetical protein n=1 Tax=Cyanobacterium aponinum TaxID=379064 RepID=UPI001F4F37B1|nr:hypothetical protein [Cyanobacterium aponinum]
MVNGDTKNRLAGNLHISIPNVPNSAVIKFKDRCPNNSYMGYDAADKVRLTFTESIA